MINGSRDAARQLRYVDLDAAYSNDGAAALWQRALRELRIALHAKACAITVHNYATDCGRLLYSVGVDDTFVRSYETTYSSSNLCFEHEEAFRTACVVPHSHSAADIKKLVRTRFYNEWIRPQNLYHYLIGVLDRQGDTLVCVVLARSRAKPAFNGEDISKFKSFLPVLALSWNLTCAARARIGQSSATWNVLDRLALGVVLVDAGGRITAMNRSAEEIVDRGDVLAIANGSLTCRRPAEKARLCSLLQEVLSRSSGQSAAGGKALALNQSNGGAPLEILATRLGASAFSYGQTKAVAAVFLSDPSTAVGPKPEWLQDLYGLTPTETQIAVLRCQGFNADEIASTSRVSAHTVRRYLKAIYMKIGVTRHSAMIWRTAKGLGQIRADLGPIAAALPSRETALETARAPKYRRRGEMSDVVENGVSDV